MFHSPIRLPHPLPTSAYHADEQFTRERDLLRTSAWHLVATTEELSEPGSFVTRDLLQTPIQVRNFDGQIRTLSNVCAHRHCLIDDAESGRSETMTCPYHGWEYGEDGFTRKIPSPKNFCPFDQGRESIPVFRTETLGGLVFVALRTEVPSLRDYLGDYADVLERRTGPEWVLNLTWERDYDANWKIAIENSLEAYHVPHVHPTTFKADPGEDRSEHRLMDDRTEFATTLPFCPHSRLDAWFQRFEARFLRMIGATPTAAYRQHHLFPNLMFSTTDTITMVHAVVPTSATTSRSIVRQYGRICSDHRVKNWLSRRWAGLTGWVTRRVLEEDAAMLPRIQAGIEHSPHVGLLGRCEERLYAFQGYIAERTGAITAPQSQAG